eukprot:8538435-Alexandrium_andersonii.AAC.1
MGGPGMVAPLAQNRKRWSSGSAASAATGAPFLLGFCWWGSADRLEDAAEPPLQAKKPSQQAM